MTEDLADTVATVLDRIDAAYEEYEQGYADADATLAVIDAHLEELREVSE